MESGKVVVVTGAARGLGRALAAGLVEAGCRVVAVHRPRPDGDPAVDGALRIEADVTSEDDCRRVVAETVDCYGSLDVLVNNAAIAHDPFPRHHGSELVDVAVADWRRVFETNVTGVFLMGQAAVPGMVERGWGRVVNVSTSKSSMLMETFLPYGPSKAAVEAITAGWAARLDGTGVTVNEVLPGGATGEHVPDELPRWPAAIMVPPVRWLASPASDGVTGRRFIARLWYDERPEAAGFPAGWPLEAYDFAERPVHEPG